jgi:hypothetical protein
MTGLWENIQSYLIVDLRFATSRIVAGSKSDDVDEFFQFT